MTTDNSRGKNVSTGGLFVHSHRLRGTRGGRDRLDKGCREVRSQLMLLRDTFNHQHPGDRSRRSGMEITIRFGEKVRPAETHTVLQYKR